MLSWKKNWIFLFNEKMNFAKNCTLEKVLLFEWFPKLLSISVSFILKINKWCVLLHYIYLKGGISKLFDLIYKVISFPSDHIRVFRLRWAILNVIWELVIIHIDICNHPLEFLKCSLKRSPCQCYHLLFIIDWHFKGLKIGPNHTIHCFHKSSSKYFKFRKCYNYI